MTTLEMTNVDAAENISDNTDNLFGNETGDGDSSNDGQSQCQCKKFKEDTGKETSDGIMVTTLTARLVQIQVSKHQYQ